MALNRWIATFLRPEARRWAEPVPSRRRLMISVVCALVAGAVTVQSNLTLPWHRDFGQAWFAAGAVLRGENPYALIGPGLEFDWPWPFIYPLTSAIAAIPLAPFPEHVAVVIFSMIGGGVLAVTTKPYHTGTS